VVCREETKIQIALAAALPPVLPKCTLYLYVCNSNPHHPVCFAATPPYERRRSPIFSFFPPHSYERRGKISGAFSLLDSERGESRINDPKSF
jgi:hypothetical protein